MLETWQYSEIRHIDTTICCLFSDEDMGMDVVICCVDMYREHLECAFTLLMSFAPHDLVLVYCQLCQAGQKYFTSSATFSLNVFSHQKKIPHFWSLGETHLLLNIICSLRGLLYYATSLFKKVFKENKEWVCYLENLTLISFIASISEIVTFH